MWSTVSDRLSLKWNGQYKWILEFASQFLGIFMVIGALKILQRETGRVFVNHIFTDLKRMWPERLIMHGRLRHPQN